MTAREAAPGQAAYELGDQVQVTGTIIAINSRFRWVTVKVGGDTFSVSIEGAGPNLTHAAAAAAQPAPEQPETLSDALTVRFPADMINVVKQIAAAEGMTVSAWIRREVEREAGRREQPAPGLAAYEVALTSIRQMCENPKQAAGQSQGVVVNGERLAGLILAVIKAAGLEDQ